MAFNFFQVSDNDQSVGYLAQIFGRMYGVIPVNASTFGDITLLSTMFRTFNGVILTVAVIMLVYITIIGVIATAAEGEFMGKKYNNIWVPLRALMGIAMLVPTSSGYCGLQIIMMWVIVQGIGAADTLWNTALSYVNLMGSPFAQGSVPNIGVDRTLKDLYAGLVCQASARWTDANYGGATGSEYYCNTNVHGRSDPSFCSRPFDSLATTVGNASFSAGYTTTLGPSGNGSCGNLVYCQVDDPAGACGNPNSLLCKSCQAQTQALAVVVPYLTNLAWQLVAADASYRHFYYYSGPTVTNSQWQWIYDYCAAQRPAISQRECTPNLPDGRNSSYFPAPFVQGNTGNTHNPPDELVKKIYWPYWPAFKQALGDQSDPISVAASEITKSINKVWANMASQQGAAIDLQQAAKQGWIFAGSYYLTIANKSNSDMKQAMPTMKFNNPDMGSFEMRIYRNNMSAAGALLAAASGNTGAMGEGSAAASDASQTIVQGLSNTSSNPLAVTIGIGTTMIVIAEITFIVVGTIIAILAGALLAANANVLGTGISGAENLLLSAEAFFLPLFYGVLAFLVGIGGLLAVYTPMVPFIIFTFGAIHWVILTIEAMVAAPLVALFVISPSGQHEILGKAEPALGLLFNIFLRPSLMIFGMMSAMLLASAMVGFVNMAFRNVIVNLAVGDPLSMVLILVAYTMLVLTVLNKCFEVINIIPTQVMRWVSIQAEAVQAPGQEIKGAVEAGAGKVGGAAQAGIGGQASWGSKQAEADAKAEERKPKPQPDDSGAASSKPTEGGGGGP